MDEAISKAEFKPNLVSIADDVRVIHKTIIQNLYAYPIVVCDVSARNPNVLFELGMRVAFEKPVVIVKDDQTKGIFDLAPIEYIEYPRDLRYAKIQDFKLQVAQKIKNTFDKSKKDPDSTSVLKQFGEFTRLDNFAIHIQNNPGVKGYIQAYGPLAGQAYERKEVICDGILAQSTTLMVVLRSST